MPTSAATTTFTAIERSMMKNHTRSHKFAITACLMVVMLPFLTNWSAPSAATNTSESRLTNIAWSERPPSVTTLPAKTHITVQTDDGRGKSIVTATRKSAERLPAQQNGSRARFIPAAANDHHPYCDAAT